MKIFSKILKNKFRLFMTAIVFLSISFNPVIAATSSEIGQQIDQKKTELDALKKQLSSLEKEKTTLTKQKSGIQGEIESVQNEIKLVTNNITTNEIKIQELDKEKEIKELEIDNRRLGLNSKMSEFYMLQYDSDNSAIVPGNDMEISWVGQKYSKLIIEKERAKITILGEEVMGITKAIEEQNAMKNEYSAKNVELDKEKKELEAKLASLQGNINTKNQQGGNIKNQITTTQDQVKKLENQYKSLLELERQKMNKAPVEEIVELKSGQYYFTGKIRDYANGHYVGMSQWGAYGMAKAGKNYIDILTKFYTGVQVTNSAVSDEGTIWVRYCKSSPLYGDYDACPKGQSDAVIKSMKIKDYLANLSEIPSSWPLESQKAQMVAARTYALRATGNGSELNPICTTAECQAVNPDGSGRFMSVVNETAGKVVTYNGALISAVYTSSACGYTEDNDKVFMKRTALVGTAQPYLRSVDYSEYYEYWHSAQVAMNGGEKKDPCNYRNYSNLPVGWRTNGYSLSEISEKVNFVLAKLNKSSIGELKSIKITKTPAGHVWKVEISGTAGNQAVSGYWFKYSWNNELPGINHPNFIYGLDFSFVQAQ